MAYEIQILQMKNLTFYYAVRHIDICVNIVFTDHYLRVQFTKALPSTSYLQGPPVMASQEACLRIEVTTSIYDTNTFGGLTLHIQHSDHSEPALILHAQAQQLRVTQMCDMEMPAGNYSFSLIAQGNMNTELAIDNIQLNEGSCEQPSEYTCDTFEMAFSRRTYHNDVFLVQMLI